MTETAGRRWCEVCKMFFPYGYGCDTPDKKHEWVVPAADLDALRERLEKAVPLLDEAYRATLGQQKLADLISDAILILEGAK